MCWREVLEKRVLQRCVGESHCRDAFGGKFCEDVSKEVLEKSFVEKVGRREVLVKGVAEETCARSVL